MSEKESMLWEVAYTFAFGHDMLVNRVTQVDSVDAERSESGDEGAVQDVSEGQRRSIVLWPPQPEKGEQGHG